MKTIEDVMRALPLEEAMPALLPMQPSSSAPEVPLHEEALTPEEGSVGALVAELQASPHVMAGLWLYVDDLERSHAISQSLEDSTGSAWHAIMHRREGDFANSKYWWRRAGSHPAFAGFDNAGLVDRVAQDGGRNAPELLALQREEWKRLMDWCLAQEVASQ